MTSQQGGDQGFSCPIKGGELIAGPLKQTTAGIFSPPDPVIGLLLVRTSNTLEENHLAARGHALEHASDSDRAVSDVEELKRLDRVHSSERVRLKGRIAQITDDNPDVRRVCGCYLRK
jgi:hypothetical protein